MNYLQKELYSLIQKDETIFDFIQESALDGLWYWDLENPAHEWMNPKFWTTLGYDPKEMPHLASAWQEIINQDDFEIAKNEVAKHLQNPDYPYEQIIRYRHANGTAVWIQCRGLALRDSDGKPLRMIGAHTDVTSLKRKEEVLARCNEEAKIGYWEVDLIKSKVFWGDITKKIHEVESDFEPDLETGINFYEEGYSRSTITKLVNNAIEHGESFKQELRIRTKNNVLKCVKAIGIPEVFQGKCIRIYGTFQDISERKENEQKINNLLVTSEQQNERLKNFAHIVSHNLRSHSSGISMLLELYKDEEPQAFENEIIKHLLTASDNLNQTIAHLTEIVQINTANIEALTPINLLQSINNAIANVHAKARNANYQIIVLISEEVQVKAIAAYMDSICLNFITNAVKYRSNDRVGVLKISCYEENEFVVIQFSDNGLGIDLNRHGSHLFGMYKTFHKNENAQGIGLFITKNQVDALGGKIEVSSEVNVGTDFKVYLLK